MTFQEWVQEVPVVDGLVRIFKPYGIPSTAVVEMYKQVSKQKVGHGGTLDPLAEGALLLGIGKGTKLLTKFLESDKRYRTRVLLGVQTESGDLELPIKIQESKFEGTLQKLNQILQELSSDYQQELPALSSAKQQGKTSYDLVREGKQPEKRFIMTKLLEYKLHSFANISANELQELLCESQNRLTESFKIFHELSEQIGYKRKFPYLLEKWVTSFTTSRETIMIDKNRIYGLVDIEVLVPKGTYIRSLATDIASRLGTVGTLLSLVRLTAGNR